MISIIIPVFNAEKYIADCIKSIEEQEYKDVEIIIVNDGSTDCSLKICKSLCNQYSNIKLISVPNGGVSKARNIGLDYAIGEYVQFVDADDTVSFNYSSKMMKSLLENKVDLVISSYTEVHMNNDVVISQDEGAFNYKDDFFKKLLQTNRLINSPCNKLFIRDKICSKFSEDLTLGEDLVFCLEYMKQCKTCYFINDSLYNYISHGGSLTTKFSEQKLENLIKLDTICCEQYGLSTEYFTNFIENIYDTFCIMAKDSTISIDNKKEYVKHLFDSIYILNRLKLKENGLRFKHKVFVYLLKNRRKSLLVILLKILSNKS